MTTHTGFGRSNEVAYTYDLFDDSWYGRYMCRVEESLLDHPLREFYTDHFNIGGYPWQLFLQRTSDGDLSAFLYSKSTCSSFVYFSIALVNRNDEKSKVWGSSKEFTSMPSWGVKKLASVLDIKDANNGFIHRGFFIIRLKMRLRLPGNEFRSLATDEGTKVFTWKLKDLHERSPHCMVTEPLHVGDSTWRIVLYPRGKGREKEYMAVCLCLDDESSAKAKFQVSVVNHVSTAKSISKEFVHSFTKCGQSHGFDQFLVSDLLDHELSGFIKDGWITLTARISKCCKSVQFAEAPKVHQPKVRPPVAEAPKVHQPKVRPPVALLSELHLDERQRSIPSATVEEVPKVEPQQEEKETHRRRGSKYLDMIQSTNSALWDLKNQKKPLESVVQKQAIVRTILDHECYTDRIDEKEDVIRSRSLGDIPRWLANAGPEDDESDREYDLSESLSGLVAGVSFANKYLIEAESSEGKPDVRLAINKHSRQSVILKFYPTRQLFEKSLEFTQMLCPSHVSKAIEVIYNDKDQYPPCLVFERGSETLEQWMQSSNTDLWRKKSTLRRVLECLRHIHSYGIVHCDVKPTNVMYFSSSDSWKLLDTELGAKKGETRAIHNTLYASPVTLQIEGSGRTAITLDTSVDIWSYGVIAYEVLSGVRVSGMLTSGQMLKNWMSGSRLPGLNVADDRQAKEWLEHLLCTDARYRWSAEMALGHAFLQRTKVQKPHEFHSVVSSANEVKSEVPETKCEAPQMKNEVAEVMKEDVKLNGMTLEEMRAANLMITIVLEESALIDGSSSWKSKNFRETMMMHHDTMQNEPVFLLLVGRPLRLRVGLKHKTKERSSSRKISGVRVRASDGNSVLLMTEETRSASAGHEVVAFLNPTDLKSMKFRRVSPTVGTPEEKYATLEVSVDVTCEEGGVSQTTVWKGEVVCNMIKYGRRINFRRFLERTGDVWNSTPEWMKEGAKGAIILATVGTGSWN